MFWQVPDGGGRRRTQANIVGKRVGGNPSGVRISYPPPPVTRQYVRPVMRSAWPPRLRCLICSLTHSTHIGIKRPKVQARLVLGVVAEVGGGDDGLGKSVALQE